MCIHVRSRSHLFETGKVVRSFKSYVGRFDPTIPSPFPFPQTRSRSWNLWRHDEAEIYYCDIICYMQPTGSRQSNFVWAPSNCEADNLAIFLGDLSVSPLKYCRKAEYLWNWSMTNVYLSEKKRTETRLNTFCVVITYLICSAFK